MKKLVKEELKDVVPAAYEFLCAHDMLTLPEGRYELGDSAYVNIESYNSFERSERQYESHINYIDVQYIISGEELIEVEATDNLTITTEYDPARDAAFYSNETKGTEYHIGAEEMLYLEPEDGHMPGIKVNDSVPVKKALFKIPVKK